MSSKDSENSEKKDLSVGKPFVLFERLPDDKLNKSEDAANVVVEKKPELTTRYLIDGDSIMDEEHSKTVYEVGQQKTEIMPKYEVIQLDDDDSIANKEHGESLYGVGQQGIKIIPECDVIQLDDDNFIADGEHGEPLYGVGQQGIKITPECNVIQLDDDNFIADGERSEQSLSGLVVEQKAEITVENPVAQLDDNTMTDSEHASRLVKQTIEKKLLLNDNVMKYGKRVIQSDGEQNDEVNKKKQKLVDTQLDEDNCKEDGNTETSTSWKSAIYNKLKCNIM